MASLDGKCLACTYRAKYVEVSVGINHNVDELLAGTLTQIRLKKEQNALQVCISSNLYTEFILKSWMNIFVEEKSQNIKYSALNFISIHER